MEKKAWMFSWFLAILLLLSGGCKSIMGPIKADLLMDINRYDQALLIYEEYLQTTPATANILGKMGYAYFKTGRLDQAMAKFKEALTLEPAHADSTLYLGLIYLQQKDFRMARETWRSYKNEEAPLVEEEMRRLTTMVNLVETREFAQKALGQEKELQVGLREANTIAVSQFRNISSNDELDAFGKGLSAMVASDLAKIKSLRVFERIKLQALLDEMALGQTGVVDAESAPRVGKLLGVENLVVGSLGEGIEVNSALANVSRSSLTTTTAVVIPMEKFFEVPSKVVIDVAAGLGVSLSPEELADIDQPQTTSYKAVVFYGKGLQAFDAGEWKRAKEFFGLAHKEDPSFFLAKDALASSPGPGYPAFSAVAGKGMTGMGLAGFAEEAVGEAEAAQGEAAEAAEAAAGGGGN